MDLPNYIYISKNKVEILFPLLPPSFSDGVNPEIEANLGILKAKLSGSQSKDCNWLKQFITVKSYIESHYDLGNIAYPGEWVKDTVRVRRVSFSPNENNRFNDDAKDLLWLAGVVDAEDDSSGTIPFAIVGSSKHELANMDASSNKVGLSYLPHIINILPTRFDQARYVVPEKYARDVRVFGDRMNPAIGVERNELAHAIHRIATETIGFEFDVEFLARPIFEERVDEYGRAIPSGNMTRMFTPLYVTLKGWQ